MALSLCYLALCRLLGLLRSSRRPEIDKDIELMVLRHARAFSTMAPGSSNSYAGPEIALTSAPVDALTSVT